MAQFVKTASVAEKTVQAVARGEIEQPTARRTAGDPDHSNSSVTVTKLHEELVAYLKLNDVSMRRVEVLSEREIIVWNRPLDELFPR
jgi:hypothetical protein